MSENLRKMTTEEIPDEMVDREMHLKELESVHPCNVIREYEFKNRIASIFDLLADIVGKTVGPYGSTTMIEELGSYHMTKDGFTVLKNIHFNNRTDNTILNMILTISHQMVMKVGDGSTTAVLAAHKFLEILRADDTLGQIRPKDLVEHISAYIKELSNVIQRNAVQVTEENYASVMERIAQVALNDNLEYTNYIKEIYEKSGLQTNISKKMSPTDKSSYKIMDDLFYISGTWIDKIYCNAENGNRCIIRNPRILLFNFTLGNEHWDVVKLALQHVMKNYPGDRFVIIAPNYDQFFLDHVKADAMEFMQAYNEKSSGGAIPFAMVFARATFFKSVDKKVYDDLGPFLGSLILNPLVTEDKIKKIGACLKMRASYAQAKEDYNRAMQYCIQHNLNPKEEIKIEIPKDDGDKMLQDLEDSMKMYIGTCDEISIGKQTIEFTGFTNINQNLVDIQIADAKDQYEKELNEIENLRYISKEYIDAKERLARIACKSAIIYVGGNSDLEKKLNDDSLDDAIHACQSAATYGYNLGNNMAILQAINEVRETSDNAVWKELGNMIESAIICVIQMVYTKKHWNLSFLDTKKILYEGLEKHLCYDLNTDEYSDKIINSCRTDIEILKGAISIIALILSANQYLAIEVQTQNAEKK